jgi:Ca-activated chloride channel family protein
MGLPQTQRGRPIGRRRHVPAALFLIGVTILFVALARPQMKVDTPRRTGTIILAFDVSASMSADDVKPSRLEAAQQAARELVARQPGNIKVGVVTFASGGFQVQPPTRSKDAVLRAIQRLTPEGSTSIQDGIFASISAIAGKPLKIDQEALAAGAPQPAVKFLGSSAVVMFSDGENSQNINPIPAADVAAQAGVRIFPVGIGTATGAVIQSDGYSIATQLDEGVLRQVAKATNGAYFRAEDASRLRHIYDSIDLRLTFEGQMTEITSILAGVALVFLLVGAVLSMLWFGRTP